VIRRLVLLACALAAFAALPTVAAGPALAATPKTTLNDVEDEVMCPVCGVPLNIAEAPQAQDERALIRDLIAEGKSKDEVKQALIAEYGRAVLATPGDDGFAITNWLVPALVGLALAGAALVLLPRWRRRPTEAPSADAPPELSPQEQGRLDEDLARFR
jgi:cytochrome c-type biogenesis protein CcmH